MTDQSIPLPVLPARVSPGRAYFQCRNSRSKAGQDRKGKGKQRAYNPDESKSYSGLSFDAIYAGLEHSPVLKKLQQRTATVDSQRYSPPSQDVETVLYIEKDQSEATTHAGITEELAWSGSTLVWSKGSSVYRTHTFSEDADDKYHVLQALFAFFEVPAPPRADALADSSLPPEQRPTSPPSLVSDNGSSTSTDSNDALYGPFHPRTAPPAWSDDNSTASISQEAASTLTSVQQVRVLVVLLQEELRLYYPGGQLHIVPLSFPVSKIWAMERGLLLEKQTGAMKSTPHWLSGLSRATSSSTQSLPEPVFYSIIDPYEDAKPLTKVPDLLNIPAAKPLDPLKARQEAKTTRMTEAAVFCEDGEKIIFISDRRDSSDPILLTMNCKTAKLSIWAYTTLVRDPMQEITAFRQSMKDEATAHHLNGMRSDRTLDLGSTSMRPPHATLGKRRRGSDEQSMHLPSSELDIPGLTTEHNTSHRSAGSTATQRRVSALLDRRKSQHNPNATVSELLGGLAPAGLPLSNTSNGVAQDKQHRRTSLLKAATSAGMDRRSSTTRNELSVSLDRMAIGATNSHVHPHTLSQHTQLPALSQTSGMSVEPGQLALHEKQERLEAIVGNGDMERETSLRVSPHINKEPESDIYITRLYRTEVPGISNPGDIQACMFAATAEGSRLAILVPGQQSLILLSITTQGTSNGSTLLCQPMRHLNATSMAPAYSTVEGCCDLLVLNSRGELHIISQDDRQLPVHPGQLEGKPTMLRASSLSTVEVVCTLADGSRQSIDVQTLLKTKFPLVDHVISVLASYLGESFSPVLVKFWQLHWKLRSRSLEGVLRALELAIVGGEADLADFAPSMHIHEGLSDWEWMQQDEASSADRSSSTVMAAGLPDDHLALCLYALHLVSEERKLFLATQRDVAALAYLIKKVAQKISAWDYVDVANRDGAPDKVKDVLHCTGCPSHHLPLPFDVHANLLRRLQLEATPRDPFVPMNVLSGELSQYSSGSSRSAREHFRPMRSLLSLYDLFRASSLTSSPLNGLEDAVLACANRGLTQDDLSALTAAVSLPLREAIRQCHGNAPSTWPKRAFALVDRADQMATAKGPAIGRRREPVGMKKRSQYTHDVICDTTRNVKPISHVQHLMKRKIKDKATRFSLDHRLDDVARMLSYTAPQIIRLPKTVQPTEAELPKVQQEYLVHLARRTLALPVGAGMFFYRATSRPRSSGISIPKVELSAKILPSASYATPSIDAIPPEEKTWPYFHSGVATALHIAWSKHDFDASEYAFHKPAELNARHGGFLLGLGMTGQIRSLGTYQAFKYMDPKHEYTSVGLLLGLGAAYLGTADVKVSSALAVHTAALHPPSATPLNVSLSLQAAGLFGIGLVHVASANRTIADNILKDLSQTHISGTDHPDGCLEAYAISSGFAYGLVMLGRGNEYGGACDANILGTFKYLLEGGRGSHLPGAKKNVEGTLNAAVTSPAATIALGLTFLQTDRKDVAALLEIPQSIDRLDHVRNDLILLRTICRHLIEWSDLACTKASVEAVVPPFIAESRQHGAFPGGAVPTDQEVAYWHIVAGGCLSVGFKFAGSAKVEAHSLLVEYLDRLVRKVASITVTASLRSKLAHQSLQNCVNTICLGLASVMAGTGELNVLKRLRVMHGQIKEGMSYGTHMALHMALGLLFLGKGRFTLGTSKVAISALLCSFYPVFPPHPSSNRFHLQALRHMWVLAVEPRCLIAKDVESGKSVYLRLKFKLREQFDGKARETLTSKYLTAPTLTPSMSSIVSIQTDSPRYWPVTLAFDKVKDHMRSFIRNQTIFVKRKTGHLSYAQDPRGLRSLYIQPETEGAAVVFDAGLNAKLTIDKKDALLNLLAAFQSFSSIARTDLMYFCCAENDDLSTTQLATAFMLSAVMESLVQDKPEALGLYRAFSQSFERHGAIVVRDVQSLVFTHKLCAHESYSQILQNRKQSLVRREYVESVYIETEKMVNRLLRDQSMHKSLALYLEMPSREGAIRKNDLLVSQLILPFLRSPTLGVLQDIRDKVTRLVSQGSVGRDVLHTLLPVVLARVMQQNAEGSGEQRIDRQLVVTLASALLV